MNLNKLVNGFVGSIAWRYFYLIALGVGLGFVISYFDPPTSLWYPIASIISSVAALYWNYRITQSNKSDKEVKKK